MNNDSLRLQKNASKTTLLLSGKLPYKSSLVSNHCSQRTISMPPGLHLLLGWVGFLSEQGWTDNTCRSRAGGWPVAAASYTVSAPRDPETHFTHDKGLNPSTCRCTGGGVRSPTWLVSLSRWCAHDWSFGVYISVSSKHSSAGAVIHLTQVRENANFDANPV